MTSEKTDSVSVGHELEYVCDVRDLANNEMRRHEAGDGRAVAICRVGNEFFGVDDLCTHEKAWLTDGYLEDYVIECPLHGGSFDIRTGQAKSFPCTKAIRTHQVVVDRDQVLLGWEKQS